MMTSIYPFLSMKITSSTVMVRIVLSELARKKRKEKTRKEKKRKEKKRKEKKRKEKKRKEKRKLTKSVFLILICSNESIAATSFISIESSECFNSK
jgi:DNA invertase Pin-like site-specific DNA recombinase